MLNRSQDQPQTDSAATLQSGLSPRAARFGTSQRRGILSRTREDSPGPGEYFQTPQRTQADSLSRLALIASKVRRFEGQRLALMHDQKHVEPHRPRSLKKLRSKQRAMVRVKLGK